MCKVWYCSVLKVASHAQFTASYHVRFQWLSWMCLTTGCPNTLLSIALSIGSGLKSGIRLGSVYVWCLSIFAEFHVGEMQWNLSPETINHVRVTGSAYRRAEFTREWGCVCPTYLLITVVWVYRGWLDPHWVYANYHTGWNYLPINSTRNYSS